MRIEVTNDAWTCEEDWTQKGFAPYFNDAISYEGYCYGSHRKNLTCIDAASGEEQWHQRIFGGQMVLLPAMDAVLSLSEKGDLMVFRASPERFDELAHLPKVLKGESLNHPVIAHGKLFLRDEREAVCYALPE